MTGSAVPVTVLVADRDLGVHVPKAKSVTVVKRVSAISTAMERAALLNLFVLTSATELGKIASVFKASRSRNLLRALFVRRDLQDSWLADAFDESKIRSLRNVIVYDGDAQVPQRVLNAWSIGAQEKLIADAKVDTGGGHLIVRDCAFKRYDVQIADLPELRAMAPSALSDFTVSESGSYLYWPGDDVYIGIETLKYVVDGSFRAKMEQRKDTYFRDFGQSIAHIRKRCGLRQSDIEGVSPRQIGRIERGESSMPRTSTLSLLAKAHGLSLSDYLEQVGEVLARRQGVDPSAGAGPKVGA